MPCNKLIPQKQVAILPEPPAAWLCLLGGQRSGRVARCTRRGGRAWWRSFERFCLEPIARYVVAERSQFSDWGGRYFQNQFLGLCVVVEFGECFVPHPVAAKFGTVDSDLTIVCLHDYGEARNFGPMVHYAGV